jgi:hypothetical protein
MSIERNFHAVPKSSMSAYRPDNQNQGQTANQGQPVNKNATTGINPSDAVTGAKKGSYKPKEDILVRVALLFATLMGTTNECLQNISRFILQPSLGMSNELAKQLGSINFQLVEANNQTQAASANLHNNTMTALSAYINAQLKNISTGQSQDMQLATSTTQNISQITSLIQSLLQTYTTCIQAIASAK